MTPAERRRRGRLRLLLVAIVGLAAACGKGTDEDPGPAIGDGDGGGAVEPAPTVPDDLAEAALAAPLETDGFRLPAYEELALANGARFVLVPKRDVPLVAFEATIAGGVVAEPPEHNGVAALTAALLRQGAGSRDAAAFSEAVDAVGGTFEIEAALEAIVLRGEFMRRDADLMVSLLADVLRRPALSSDAFDRLRTRAIQALAAARDADLRSLILPYAHAFVHGDHPYGRPPTGTEESLARLAHRDVQAFYREQFGADRLTLTVVGDFEPAAMRARLTAAFDGWREAAGAAPEVPGTVPADGGRVLLVDKPGATQTYFWIGNLGVARGDPDTPAVDLVNTLFGGRFTSMLNTALRVDSGLTYGAHSLLERHRQPGLLGMLSFCATENTVEAIDLALTQLDRLHDGGLDARALASGRNYVVGTYTLGLETFPQLAAALAELKFYGLPDAAVEAYASRVAAVSGPATEAVIRRVYPTRDQLVFVLIGDAEAIRAQAARYGEVTELPLAAPRFGP